MKTKKIIYPIVSLIIFCYFYHGLFPNTKIEAKKISSTEQQIIDCSDNIRTSLAMLSIALENDKYQYKDGFSYEPVPDSIKQIMNGSSYKKDCSIPWSELNYVKIKYINFEGLSSDGEIICNKTIAKDLVEIFYELYCNEYPIEEVSLIDYYQADDELSMEHNNTSCFNYRTVPGKTTLSKHSLGLAIDINPFYNPYVTYGANGSTNITPFGSDLYANRDTDFAHKISKEDLCYKLFISHGFTWGGNWKSCKDYQHFQKS